MKKAVILFNLGGPDSINSVKPFLFNLFNDPAIIRLPNPFRYLLAKFISHRREKTAITIYKCLGGKSPILNETKAQADALEEKLREVDSKNIYKIFIVMRYWHPFAQETIKQIKEYGADKIILLPLYPQFSTSTTASSFKQWKETAAEHRLNIETQSICCYPRNMDFIKAHVGLIKQHYKNGYRLLFSAHGIPKSFVKDGDPYQWQIEQTVNKIVDSLNLENLDWKICYQSKVGRMKWLEPSTENEIIRAGKEKKSIIVIPIAFVSEHSETLVELDIEYKELAESVHVPDYIRVPTVNINKDFILSLAMMCMNNTPQKICPAEFTGCGYHS